MANQKLQLARPVPMDVGSVKEQNGESPLGLKGATYGASQGTDAVSQNIVMHAGNMGIWPRTVLGTRRSWGKREKG